MTERIEQHAQTDPVAKRLMSLCGVGTLTASALGNAQAFKRGDSYLHTLLIHGARAALRWNEDHEDNLSQWVRQPLVSLRAGPLVGLGGT